MLTGGISAEFGFGTGGVLNVVTKSGGNSFSGTFDARYSDQRFHRVGRQDESDEEDFFNRVFAATVGGPILRDRLWFFAAVEQLACEDTPGGAPETTVRDRELVSRQDDVGDQPLQPPDAEVQHHPDDDRL